MSLRWHIITGEYPPQRGGVSDYARNMACGLASAGDEVIIWAPQCDGPPPDDGGVEVRRLPGHFAPRALAELDAGLRRQPGRVLLQYTPHAFGFKAMNVPLCVWLCARGRPLDVLFHEVAFPYVSGQPLRHKVLATVHRGMAALLLRAADRVMVSTPAWSPLLRRLAHRKQGEIWIPISSNLPIQIAEDDVRALRRRLEVGPQNFLVGHFGTYGPVITRLLEPALRDLLVADPNLKFLLLGQGSKEFAAELTQKGGRGIERIQATGELPADVVATHIGACDLMLQPYPDGITSRRGSAIAALALTRPLVTTTGELTEPFWAESRAVVLATPHDLAQSVLTLGANAAHRAELAQRAAALYRNLFAMERTIQSLREIPARS